MAVLVPKLKSLVGSAFFVDIVADAVAVAAVAAVVTLNAAPKLLLLPLLLLKVSSSKGLNAGVAVTAVVGTLLLVTFPNENAVVVATTAFAIVVVVATPAAAVALASLPNVNIGAVDDNVVVVAFVIAADGPVVVEIAVLPNENFGELVAIVVPAVEDVFNDVVAFNVSVLPKENIVALVVAVPVVVSVDIGNLQNVAAGVGGVFDVIVLDLSIVGNLKSVKAAPTPVALKLFTVSLCVVVFSDAMLFNAIKGKVLLVVVVFRVVPADDTVVLGVVAVPPKLDAGKMVVTLTIAGFVVVVDVVAVVTVVTAEAVAVVVVIVGTVIGSFASVSSFTCISGSS